MYICLHGVSALCLVSGAPCAACGDEVVLMARSMVYEIHSSSRARAARAGTSTEWVLGVSLNEARAQVLLGVAPKYNLSQLSLSVISALYLSLPYHTSHISLRHIMSARP